jgi:hypothetical protein
MGRLLGRSKDPVSGAVQLGLAIALACCGGPTDPPDGGSEAGMDASSGGCTGASDGAPCGDASVCIDGACTSSRCGDGIVDARTEDCDDENTVAFDGCESTCVYTCDSDAVCDDLMACNGVEVCAEEHVCASGTMLADGAVCTLDGGGSGACRAGSCIVPACGDGVVDAGESCDDGNTTPRDGCELDCRFSCETDPTLTQTWYVDCDGDGRAGTGATSRESCLEPAASACGGGWTLVPPTAGTADCDDTDPEVGILRCYQDGDRDGYALSGATALAPGCPPIGDGLGTGGCPTGYTNRDPAVAANVDCDDANAGESVCAAGQRCCSAGCVDEASTAHCGACGVACGAGERCCAGVCSTIYPDNCETCGEACDAERSDRCAGAGVCRCGSNAQCDADERCCAGSCVRLADSAHCGGCGMSCGRESDTCSGGECACGGGAPCAAGQHCCGGACFPLGSTLHCGSCYNQCNLIRASVCNGTSCRCNLGPECSTSQRCCSEGCVNAFPSNCGGCGIGCATGSSDRCQGSACMCGAGPACPSGQRCCAGACVAGSSCP